jgi:hypothetical protein
MSGTYGAELLIGRWGPEARLFARGKLETARKKILIAPGRVRLEGSRVVVALRVWREESTFAGASDTSKGELGLIRGVQGNESIPF